MEIRRTLRLPLDDLLVVVREFLNPKASRSGLARCLKRHGLNRRPVEDKDAPIVRKTFKDYAPGFVHMDIKYLPQMQDETARQWGHRFVQWYNGEHRHSAIRYVTPNQRHEGLDTALLRARKVVYEEAKRRNPARWSGDTRNWEPVSDVWLNPPKESQTQPSCEAETA